MKVEWFDHKREPQCAPDPAFPNGKDINTVSDRPSCKADLPYPAQRCGLYIVGLCLKTPSCPKTRSDAQKLWRLLRQGSAALCAILVWYVLLGQASASAASVGVLVTCAGIEGTQRSGCLVIEAKDGAMNFVHRPVDGATQNHDLLFALHNTVVNLPPIDRPADHGRGIARENDGPDSCGGKDRFAVVEHSIHGHLCRSKFCHELWIHRHAVIPHFWDWMRHGVDSKINLACRFTPAVLKLDSNNSWFVRFGYGDFQVSPNWSEPRALSGNQGLVGYSGGRMSGFIRAAQGAPLSDANADSDGSRKKNSESRKSSEALWLIKQPLPNVCEGTKNSILFIVGVCAVGVFLVGVAFAAFVHWTPLGFLFGFCLWLSAGYVFSFAFSDTSYCSAKNIVIEPR